MNFIIEVVIVVTDGTPINDFKSIFISSNMTIEWLCLHLLICTYKVSDLFNSKKKLALNLIAEFLLLIEVTELEKLSCASLYLGV